MKDFYKKAGTIFTLLATALAIVGCGDESNNNPQGVPSVKSIYNLGDCTSSNEKQLVYVESENSGYVCTNGDWVKADELPPNYSDESGTISIDGQVVKTTVLSNGLTYTIESVGHCPDGWHEMTIDECKALHEQETDSKSPIFADPFEIVGKTSTRDCSAGLSNECLFGTWTLNSISRIDTREIIKDFSSAQGGTLEFTDDGTYHYIRSTAGNCPGSLGGGSDDKGTWIIEEKTLTFHENKMGDCIDFMKKYTVTPTIEASEETVTMSLGNVVFQTYEIDDNYSGNGTEVFTSDISLVEICNEKKYNAYGDKKSIRGIQKIRCVK